MVGRVDDIVGGVLGELLQENFLFYGTIADVSARSWCGVNLWTYVADRHVGFATRGVR